MPSKNLRECRTVEGFENRVIVVELGEGSVEFDEENVIHAGMSDVVADRGN